MDYQEVSSPAVIINESLVHWGSIPQSHMIESWLNRDMNLTKIEMFGINKTEIGLTDHNCNSIKLRVSNVQLWLIVFQLIGDKLLNHYEHKAMYAAVSGVFYL
jgi:hypothetical protein